MKKENKNLFFASQIVTLAQKTMKINREKRIQMLFHNPLPTRSNSKEFRGIRKIVTTPARPG